MVKFHFYGHANFLIDTGHEKILFDPFFNGNPLTNVKPKDVVCDYIMLTHAHFDHYGDTNKIVAYNRPQVIAIPEVLDLLPQGYDNIQAMNIGGSHEFPFGKVTMVLAVHSSGVPGGIACGYVIEFHDAPTIYVAGDTALFYDMKTIGKKFNIDYAILPIGGNFTMEPEDAAKAARWVKASYVIPIHYNTWPMIKQSEDEFKYMVQNIPSALVEQVTPTVVQIVKPGETYELGEIVDYE